MWLTTTRGFYSAVQHRQQPDQLLIRARARADLERLLELAPDGIEPEIIELPSGAADYRYRIYIHKDVWAGLVAALLGEITYPNFKDAVKARMPKGEGAARASIYMRVWSALLAITPRGKAHLQDNWERGEPLFAELPADEAEIRDEDLAAWLGAVEDEDCRNCDGRGLDPDAARQGREEPCRSCGGTGRCLSGS